MKTVLVFGATGQQGGSVALALRKGGWSVRALVRNKNSDKAKMLLGEGVTLVTGDLADRASLEEATRGVYGVFSVQPSSGQAGSGISDDDEVRFGKAVVDVAAAAGVKHLIYSSTIAAGKGPTGLGHFESKSEIEGYVRAAGIPSTILRPATFMDMLALPGAGLEQSKFTFFVRPAEKMQWVAVQDIGRVVAQLFSRPEDYAGTTIEIAGDEISGNQMAEILTRAAKKEIAYERFGENVLRESAFLGGIAALFDDGRLAGTVDIPALESEFGRFLRFSDWLAGPGKASFEAALAGMMCAF